jgi:serine/threonine protein phosphatase PrpC
MSEGTTEFWHIPVLKIKNSLRKPTDENLWHKATFGDDPETKNNPEVIKNESSLVCAAVLNVEKDEDAPPIAKKITESTSLIFVADGMGGSGARRIETGKTTAYHGSRAAREGISSISTSDFNQDLSSIKRTVESSFARSFSSLPIVPESGLKSKFAREYPTTVSTAILTEEKDSKSVKLLWTGDSPIFIFTPEAIYTTATPESGDAPTSAVYRDHYDLDSQELTFKKDTPIMVVVASDGLLKMGGDTIGTAIRFILRNTKDSDSSTISQQMTDYYQQLKNRHEIELDDTTIALATSGDISKLRPEVPVRLINPK